MAPHSKPLSALRLRGPDHTPPEADALGEALLDLPEKGYEPRHRPEFSGGIRSRRRALLWLGLLSTRCAKRLTMYSCMQPSRSCLLLRSRQVSSQVSHVLPCRSLLENSNEKRTEHLRPLSLPPLWCADVPARARTKSPIRGRGVFEETTALSP